MFLTGVWHLDLDLDMVTGLSYTHNPNFSSISWSSRCKEHPGPLSPHLGLWRTLEVPDLGLASWYLFGYGDWPLVHTYSEFWLSILILKVQRTSMSFKSSFGALEDTGGSWLGFGILILIWIWSLNFDTSMIHILALYLDFKGENDIHVIKILIWGYGGHWRYKTLVWHLDLDLDMVTGLWYTPDLNFGSLSWFWRCKEHPCPLSPHLGLWRMLGVPDLGLPSWSWVGYGHWSLVHIFWEIWISILILKVQRTFMSFQSWFRALNDAGCSCLGFGILILI